MAILSRSDQQKVMTQYEREYHSLVMLYQTTGYNHNTVEIASDLVKEITRFSQSEYFDEDIADTLRELTSSLNKHFLVQVHAA